MSNISKALLLIVPFILTACSGASMQSANNAAAARESNALPPVETARIKNPGRVVHVLVALCDNENQGIVPVSAALGNGVDPAKNLYWGAAFGVKTFFGKSKSWDKIAEFKDPKTNVLERLVFKHKTQDVHLIADAYRGDKMRETIDDFFAAVSGARRENIKAHNIQLQILDGADLVAFVGHNGLMDFSLAEQPVKKDDKKRDAIIMACASRGHFSKPLRNTAANPLLWTTNLMAPEAYILHDALEGWAAGESDEQVRTRGAAAYAKYQKIPEKAARSLLVTGW